MTSSLNSCSTLPQPLVASGGGGAGLEPTTQATTGGGIAPAGGDIATAIANLSQAVSALSAVLQAQAGAGEVTGGGPLATPEGGCCCGSGAANSAIAGAGEVTAGGPVDTALGGGQGANAAPTTDSYAAVSAGGPAEAPPLPPTAGTEAAPPTAGGVREKILAAARGELAKNVTEDAGANEDAAGNIKKYRQAVTGPNWDVNRGPEEWCADFASWVWKDAGAAFGPSGTGEASTGNMIKQSKEMGSWKSDDPQPGDMVLFDWGGGRGSGDDEGLVDHVAIVDRVENGKVYTIGGNQSDALTAGEYALDDKQILGYVNPPGG
jgi:hypothetical protein